MIRRLANAVHDRLRGKPAALRSPLWPRVRRLHLEKYPRCAVCGGAKKLEVHHMVPFHVDRNLELDASNLITLCEAGLGGMNCHLVAGHLGCWRGWNPDVRADSAALALIFGDRRKLR